MARQYHPLAKRWGPIAKKRSGRKAHFVFSIEAECEHWVNEVYFMPNKLRFRDGDDKERYTNYLMYISIPYDAWGDGKGPRYTLLFPCTETGKIMCYIPLYRGGTLSARQVLLERNIELKEPYSVLIERSKKWAYVRI
jgi:hypothetical protein